MSDEIAESPRPAEHVIVAERIGRFYAERTCSCGATVVSTGSGISRDFLDHIPTTRRTTMSTTAPEGFFDRALAAADRLDEYQAALGDPPRNQHDEDTRLLTRAVREIIRLNAGLRAENEGYRARTNAAGQVGEVVAPPSPSEALLAAARAVLDAHDDDYRARRHHTENVQA